MINDIVVVKKIVIICMKYSFIDNSIREIWGMFVNIVNDYVGGFNFFCVVKCDVKSIVEGVMFVGYVYISKVR